MKFEHYSGKKIMYIYKSHCYHYYFDVHTTVLKWFLPKPIAYFFILIFHSLWNNALATGDSRLVASRYATNSGAVLLPTVSDTPRTDFDSIKDYFDAFLLKKPQGVVLDGDIRIGDGWAQDAG